MPRSIPSVVVLLFLASAANAEHEVVSYSLDVSNGGVIATAPANGFVLTDITVFLPSSALHVFLYEGSTSPANLKLATIFSSDQRGPIRFESGIPFSGGSDITIAFLDTSSHQFTISGYIPCPNACSVLSVPTIGTVGFVVLISGLSAAAGFVLRRRKPCIG